MRIRVALSAAMVAGAALTAGAVAPVQADRTPATPLPTPAPTVRLHAATPGDLDFVELPDNRRAAQRFDLTTPAEVATANAQPGGLPDLPSMTATQQARTLKRADFPVTYDLNFVEIPIDGLPADRAFTRADAEAAVAGINRRMRALSNGRIGYRFGSWTTATHAKSAASFACNLFEIDQKYGRYGRRSTQPSRATDEITVYVTPFQPSQQSSCDYLGVAMVGGNVAHLNGLQYTADGVPRSRHLEQWVLAHELGHNLGLRHSDLRWAKDVVIPTSPWLDQVQPYGDHLDLMGGAVAQYYEPDADWANWFLSTASSGLLGVLEPGSAQLPLVTRSGTYRMNALYADMSSRRAQGLILYGPPDSSREQGALWVLEFRSGSTAVDRSGRLNAAHFGRTHGVRIYSPQHLVSYKGRLYPVSTYQLAFGASEHSLQRSVPVGRSVRLQGTAGSKPVTVTVVSQNATSAVVRISIGSAAQTVAWPSASKFAALRSGQRLALPRRTDQGRLLTWTRTKGSACAVTRASGVSWLVKKSTTGTCTVRAAASSSTSAGVKQYRHSATFRA